MNYIVCHYSEIGLKGKNRPFFEKKLVENIRMVLPKSCSVRRLPGVVLINLKDNNSKEDIEKRLKKVFGIAYFTFAEKVDPDMKEIKKRAVEILKEKKIESFRITTKRSDKTFPLTSQEVSVEVGAEVVKELNLDVDLENYDFNLIIEIIESGAFLYGRKIKGYGGLPVSSSGRALLLLSGGIDSPVAGLRMMKRGLSLDFIHFHAYPLVSDDSIKKVKKIFKLFKGYSPNSKLFLIPFSEIQKKIRLEVPEKYRIIFYRRFMLKIAQEVVLQSQAEALVTGESLGQVSSQTLPNMRATEDAVFLPILRPLVGNNKEEIVKEAKEFETYKISILPDQDCCTLFNPGNPETRADLEEVLKIEEGLLDDEMRGLKKDCLKAKHILT